jgi:hypothetical protein
MTRYAANTDVSSSRSRDEIERMLERYGADQFLYGWQEESAVVGFRMNGRHIKFVLPLPSRDDDAFRIYMRGSVRYRRDPEQAAKLWEQATRQRWRALALVVKAKLEAVETGITTFDDEFLAHIVLPNGTTAGEWLKPQVEEAYRIGAMPALLPMLPAPTSDA